jgi:para-aminobenzoate synthetase component 1
LGAELLAAVKDQAELSMIVDLLRNDIGKVCRPGSVRVAEHKRLEKYRNVFHLVSIVEGELAAGRDSTDLIRAAFPGGSITGCPKIRSMEIIDELEPVRRHIYTGSIGYISFHDTLDLSIAIRTATVFNGRIFFSVGGGVVYDSIPADEYEETLHKGRTLMTVFKGLSEDVPKPSPNTAFVWFNGRLRPVQEACIPLSHPGFQYGYGFFETLRADNGVCRYVEEHIARLNRSWKAFMETEPPDLSWPEILSQVICKNRLENQTAAVKIIVAKGDRDKAPFTHTLAVTARPYVHRLIEKKKPGLDILTYPHPRFSPLADHKTLNYLYYLQAGQWAAKQGADEALIVNPDGTVSETNTANLLILGPDKTLIVPESAHVLPGVMRHIVCNLLENQGWKVIRRPVLPEELTSTGPVILTNSLMGAVWVRSLNNISCPAFSDNFLYELNRQMGISLTDNL